MLSRIGEIVDNAADYRVYEDSLGSTPVGLLFVPRRNHFKVFPDPGEWTVVSDREKIAELAGDIKTGRGLDDCVRVVGAPLGNGYREYAAILYAGGSLRATADPENPLELHLTGIQ